jgi:hypothetical protein
MMEWDMVAPWLQHYGCHLTDLVLRTPRLALPLQANALRPTATALEVPDSLSTQEAADQLKLSPRQLRTLHKQGKIVIVRRKAYGPGASRVQLTDVERLEADPDLQNKRRREAFMAKGRARGLTNLALRQRIHRGPLKPDNTPDWDALEARLKPRPAGCRSRPDDALASSWATLSRVELKALHAEWGSMLPMAETEDERLRLIDKRREVERRLEQLDRLEPEE